MKLSAVAAASLLQLAVALPAADITYGPPAGGWESVKYPEGTGANLDSYPPPPGGWENVKYPAGTGANAGDAGSAAPAPAPPAGSAASPFTFTSFFSVKATPDQVVNGTEPTGGLEGASGLYLLGFNSKENVVCYNITLYNFQGDYSSPADTATHLHEAAKGASGPPRIAFANPTPLGDGLARSIGCITGPFVTGLNDTARAGVDSGEGFTVSQIEDNPAGFFIDVHSSLAVPGAVRGQLA